MIVYLGMPRAASSWIFNHLSSALNYTGEKEPHQMYKTGELPSACIDFSTNNWSMDSCTAKELDKIATHYIIVARDPLELAQSYYALTGTDTSFKEFTSYMINANLLMQGDILERWMGMVDCSKILPYDYKEIKDNSQQFMSQLCNDLNIPDIEVQPDPVNTRKREIVFDTLDNDVLSTLYNQYNKYSIKQGELRCLDQMK